MKLMIDIPEDDYEFIKDLNAVMGGRVSCKTIQYNVINAIKKGTPVQTGEWIVKSIGNLPPTPYCSVCDMADPHMRSVCPWCGSLMKQLIRNKKGEWESKYPNEKGEEE